MLNKDNKWYFITFIDDCSRYCHVYLLWYKDEALNKFFRFKSEAETQTSRVLTPLRSDRGGVYTITSFDEFCQTSGIVHHEITTPYTPESNGCRMKVLGLEWHRR